MYKVILNSIYGATNYYDKKCLALNIIDETIKNKVFFLNCSIKLW